MTPKPRKPRELLYEPRHGYAQTKAKIHDDCSHPIQINSTLMSLKSAKEIHEWLGRAIAYLEGKNG